MEWSFLPHRDIPLAMLLLATLGAVVVALTKGRSLRGTPRLATVAVLSVSILWGLYTLATFIRPRAWVPFLVPGLAGLIALRRSRSLGKGN